MGHFSIEKSGPTGVNSQWKSTAKLMNARTQGASLESEIKRVEKKVDQLLDRIVDATSDSVVRAYEKRIKDLEMQKAVMRDRIANWKTAEELQRQVSKRLRLPRKPLQALAFSTQRRPPRGA